jgi:hypothetical protein
MTDESHQIPPPRHDQAAFILADSVRTYLHYLCAPPVDDMTTSQLYHLLLSIFLYQLCVTSDDKQMLANILQDIAKELTHVETA